MYQKTPNVLMHVQQYNSLTCHNGKETSTHLDDPLPFIIIYICEKVKGHQNNTQGLNLSILASSQSLTFPRITGIQ